jgi:hypothetical protein
MVLCQMDDAHWWNRPFSVFQTNLQEIDAAMDVDAALDVIEDHGADTWLLNTGGIVSFHPTDLPFQTRAAGLADRPSGDLVGDAVTAAHERAIRVIARLDLSKVSARIADEHPDWLYRSPTGEPQVYNGLWSACPSGDYYQHRSVDVIDEILDRYEVDGFFFNWFNFNQVDYSRNHHGVCHCRACHEAFAADCDLALPDGPESDAFWAWVAWTGTVTVALTRKLADHVAARRPDVGLVLRKGAAIAYTEASNSFGADVWHHATAEDVSAQVVASPDIPVLVNCVSFVDMPYRMAGEQPERFAQYLVQAIARGGNPSTYIMGAPGRIPYANLGLAREVQRFHRAHRSLYTQLRPASTTGLVRPSPFGAPLDGFGPALEEFRGVYGALQEVHHPFDVVPADSLTAMATAGLLDRFELLVLPDLGPLGPDSSQLLDDFVAAGGRLLLTGSSAAAPDGTVELASAPATARSGEPRTGADVWSTYATLVDQPDADQHRYASPVVPIFGTASTMAWKPDATRVGAVLPQAPYGPPEKCYGHTVGPDPAMAALRYGDGEVTMVPWTIGRTYREVGTTEVRGVLLAAVDRLTEAAVTAELPEQVELVLGRDQQGPVVHLINLSGARHRTFGPHLPVTGGRLRFPGLAGAGRAEALVAGTSLPLGREGDDLVVDLPTIERFEVVRVGGAV